MKKSYNLISENSLINHQSLIGQLFCLYFRIYAIFSYIFCYLCFQNLHGEKLIMSVEVKYLGVLLNSRLTKLSQNRNKPRLLDEFMTKLEHKTCNNPLTLHQSRLSNSEQNNLSLIQRMMYLEVTGEMKSTTTSALETLLDLSLLDLTPKNNSQRNFEVCVESMVVFKKYLLPIVWYADCSVKQGCGAGIR